MTKYVYEGVHFPNAEERELHDRMVERGGLAARVAQEYHGTVYFSIGWTDFAYDDTFVSFFRPQEQTSMEAVVTFTPSLTTKEGVDFTAILYGPGGEIIDGVYATNVTDEMVQRELLTVFESYITGGKKVGEDIKKAFRRHLLPPKRRRMPVYLRPAAEQK